MYNNFLQIELNNTTWEIPKDYKNLEILGAGAYGQVCSAHDSRILPKDGRDVTLRPNVAIKKLPNPFRSSIHATCRLPRYQPRHDCSSRTPAIEGIVGQPGCFLS